MKKLALAVTLACMLVACNPRPQDERPSEPRAVKPSGAQTPGPSTPAGSGATVISGSLAYNIGDVEQGIHLQGTLADESKAPNIEVKELTDGRKLISTTTISIAPPFPEHLWLRFFVVLDKLGPESPVAVRGAIGIGENNETPIQPFKFVAGRRSKIDEIKVDVMPHIKGAPESVFIGSKADAILSAPGTEIASVNPDTATGTPETTTTLLSNPIRINFKRAPQETK